ncbi:hypothetical protein BaRGS_00020113 [Batillaria attramentaria]|uniref:Uncharacterized protein n=1 Tax=Batillaria attramentaria TaxID=370345 RepID=A0ABD0KD29_9CAEN
MSGWQTFEVAKMADFGTYFEHCAGPIADEASGTKNLGHHKMMVFPVEIRARDTVGYRYLIYFLADMGFESLIALTSGDGRRPSNQNRSGIDWRLRDRGGGLMP